MPRTRGIVFIRNERARVVGWRRLESMYSVHSKGNVCASREGSCDFRYSEMRID